MTVVALIQLLQKMSDDHHKKVFALKELASLAQESRASVAMTLLRAAKKGLVARVGNLWFNQMSPPELLEIAFSLPIPSYLSFESALYHHGLLSQSPRGALTLATTGRPRHLQTPLGNIQFIHLKPSLFFGFDEKRIGVPEKAWLDLIYIRGLKSRKNILTEEIYPDRLNFKLLKKLAVSFPAWVLDLSRATLTQETGG